MPARQAQAGVGQGGGDILIMQPREFHQFRIDEGGEGSHDEALRETEPLAQLCDRQTARVLMRMEQGGEQRRERGIGALAHRMLRSARRGAEGGVSASWVRVRG
ncbi:hypothetical protein A8M77_18110 [Variovorax sp. JS1663]|nr:hypothetical protein A8M77_18110 [Variovorax sp. JS1663]